MIVLASFSKVSARSSASVLEVHKEPDAELLMTPDAESVAPVSLPDRSLFVPSDSAVVLITRSVSFSPNTNSLAGAAVEAVDDDDSADVEVAATGCSAVEVASEALSKFL